MDRLLPCLPRAITFPLPEDFPSFHWSPSHFVLTEVGGGDHVITSASDKRSVLAGTDHMSLEGNVTAHETESLSMVRQRAILYTD
jgi:hypothetical protein